MKGFFFFKTSCRANWILLSKKEMMTPAEIHWKGQRWGLAPEKMVAKNVFPFGTPSIRACMWWGDGISVGVNLWQGWDIKQKWRVWLRLVLVAIPQRGATEFTLQSKTKHLIFVFTLFSYLIIERLVNYHNFKKPKSEMFQNWKNLLSAIHEKLRTWLCVMNTV